MRLLITGGTGVLGRALRPLAEAEAHELAMPGHEELDLFDASAVYPSDGPVSEDTPVGEVLPILRSALAAEQETQRFALPGGTYNVCRDGERVSTERFTRAAGWHPQ